MAALALLLTMGCAERTPPRSPDSTASPPAVHAADLDPPGVARDRQLAETLNRPGKAFSVARIDRPGTVSVPNDRVTLVIFTGSWSQGSKMALAKIAELQRSFAGLEIAAIAMDETAADGQAFARSCGATFPVGHDPAGKKVASAWSQDPSFPNTVFLLDRKGIVRYIGRGGKDGWHPDVATQIPVEVERLLAER